MVSRVRVPVSPPTKTPQIAGFFLCLNYGLASFYTNHYTNALLEGVFYGACRFVSRSRQHVRVGVERDGDVRVSKEFLNYFRVYPLDWN